jgi:hypothetical protein
MRGERRRGAGGLEASLGRSSDAREGEGSATSHGSEGARARSESEASISSCSSASRSLEAKENSEAREARSGSGIEHPEIIRISVDALQESFSPIVIAEDEGARELLSLADQHGDRQREACLNCIQGARGSSFAISGERGRGVDACLSHGQEARAPEHGSLRIVVQLKEGDRGESLGDSAHPLGDLAPEQSGESLGLLTREANREPLLCPRELLRSIEAKGEGEAETSRLAIGEACSPQDRESEGLTIREEREGAPSSAGWNRWIHAAVPTVCEAELLAGLGRKGARVEQESSSGEAFSVCQSADTRELSSHGRSMRARRDGSSEALAREEVEYGREGEAAPLRELCIGRA